MKAPIFKNRDISWLSFNYRVLQEAKDKRVPLYERIKFLAIYSSNLDEFFRVRVAGIRSLLNISKSAQKELSFNPAELIKKILCSLPYYDEENAGNHSLNSMQVYTLKSDRQLCFSSYGPDDGGDPKTRPPSEPTP